MQKEPLFAFTGIYTLKTKIKREILVPLLMDLKQSLNRQMQSKNYNIESIEIKYYTAEKKRRS
jgi:hypothetical protein